MADLPTVADRIATLERLVKLQSVRLVQFVDLRRKLTSALEPSRKLTADERLAEVREALGASAQLDESSDLASIFRRACGAVLCSEPVEGPGGRAYNNGAREALSVMAHLLAGTPGEAMDLHGIIVEPVRHELPGYNAEKRDGGGR